MKNTDFFSLVYRGSEKNILSNNKAARQNIGIKLCMLKSIYTSKRLEHEQQKRNKSRMLKNI